MKRIYKNINWLVLVFIIGLLLGTLIEDSTQEECKSTLVASICPEVNLKCPDTECDYLTEMDKDMENLEKAKAKIAKWKEE